jgi:hypothetical protein
LGKGGDDLAESDRFPKAYIAPIRNAAFPVSLHGHDVMNPRLGPGMIQSGGTVTSCRKPRGGQHQEIPDIFPRRSKAEKKTDTFISTQ